MLEEGDISTRTNRIDAYPGMLTINNDSDLLFLGGPRE